MHEMLPWPQRSIWLGVTMAWRRPLQTTSNTRENGIQPANDGRNSPRGPSGTGSSTRYASLSVISSSGVCVSLASPTASRGTMPMPEASTSPSPRQASDAATMHSSTNVGVVIAVLPLPTQWREGRGEG
jgi:hypothetical protein